MCIKIMYNITTFKNVFQYQTANFNNAKTNYFCTNLVPILIFNYLVDGMYRLRVYTTLVSSCFLMTTYS